MHFYVYELNRKFCIEWGVQLHISVVFWSLSCIFWNRAIVKAQEIIEITARILR